MIAGEGESEGERERGGERERERERGREREGEREREREIGSWPIIFLIDNVLNGVFIWICKMELISHCHERIRGLQTENVSKYYQRRWENIEIN